MSGAAGIAVLLVCCVFVAHAAVSLPEPREVDEHSAQENRTNSSELGLLSIEDMNATSEETTSASSADPCKLFNPCVNGRCVAYATGFHCECDSDSMGTRCEAPKINNLDSPQPSHYLDKKSDKRDHVIPVTGSAVEVAEEEAEAKEDKNTVTSPSVPEAITLHTPPLRSATDYHNAQDKRVFSVTVPAVRVVKEAAKANKDPSINRDDNEVEMRGLENSPTAQHLTAPPVAFAAAAQNQDDAELSHRQLTAPPAVIAQAAAQSEHLSSLKNYGMIWAGISCALGIVSGCVLALHTCLKRRRQHARKQRVIAVCAVSEIKDNAAGDSFYRFV